MTSTSWVSCFTKIKLEQNYSNNCILKTIICRHFETEMCFKQYLTLHLYQIGHFSILSFKKIDINLKVNVCVLCFLRGLAHFSCSTQTQWLSGMAKSDNIFSNFSKNDLLKFNYSCYSVVFSASFYGPSHVCLCHSCWSFIIVTEWYWSCCHGWPVPVNGRGNVAASAALAEGMWTHWQRLEESHVDATFSSSSCLQLLRWNSEVINHRWKTRCTLAWNR